MNKAIIYIVIGMLCMVPAVAYTQEQLTLMYDSLIMYSHQTGTCDNETINNLNATSFNDPSSSEADGITGSCQYNRASSMRTDFQTQNFMDNTINQTIAVYIKQQDTDFSNTQPMVARTLGTSGNFLFQRDNVGNQYAFTYYTDVGVALATGIDASIGSNNGYRLLSAIVNYTDGTAYAYIVHNDTIFAEASNTDTVTPSTTQPLFINARPTLTQFGNYHYSAIMIFNRSLTTEDLEYINSEFQQGRHIEPVLFDAGTSDPVIDIVFPETARLYNNDPLDINYTIELDPAVSVSQIDIWINNTLNKTIFANSNTSIEIGDGLYDLLVNVTDNASNYAIDTVLNWKVDKTNPFDDLLTQIPDLTEYITSQNKTITAFNTNLFGHNVTLFDSSDAILFSTEVLNISQPESALLLEIDLAQIGAGTFRVISNESDDHTDNVIHAYGVQQNNLDRSITFNTGTAEVMVQLMNAWKKTGTSPYTPISTNVLSMRSNRLIDRYTFGFSLENHGADSYKYQFRILTDKEIYYRPLSSYQGHFVIGDNWLDFEPYDIDVFHDGQFFYVEFETTDTEIDFQSIGGVNFASTETTFIVPAPAVSSITCDKGSGSETCAFTDSETLQQTIATCTDGTQTSFIIINETNSFVFDSGTGIKAGNNYTFDNADLSFETDDIVRINATCSNEATQTISTVLFTVTETPVEDEGDVLTGIVSASAGLLVLLAIIVGIYISFTRGRKK